MRVHGWQCLDATSGGLVDCSRDVAWFVHLPRLNQPSLGHRVGFVFSGRSHNTQTSPRVNWNACRAMRRGAERKEAVPWVVLARRMLPSPASISATVDALALSGLDTIVFLHSYRLNLKSSALSALSFAGRFGLRLGDYQYDRIDRHRRPPSSSD